MDPTTTLHELLVLFAEGEKLDDNDTRMDIHYKLDDLRSWIDRDGFYPQVQLRAIVLNDGCVFEVKRKHDPNATRTQKG